MGVSLRLLNIESQNGKHLNLWRTPGRPSANQDLLACQASGIWVHLTQQGAFHALHDTILHGWDALAEGWFICPWQDWKDIMRGSVCFLAMIEDNTDSSSLVRENQSNKTFREKNVCGGKIHKSCFLRAYTMVSEPLLTPACSFWLWYSLASPSCALWKVSLKMEHTVVCYPDRHRWLVLWPYSITMEPVLTITEENIQVSSSTSVNSITSSWVRCRDPRWGDMHSNLGGVKALSWEYLGIQKTQEREEGQLRVSLSCLHENTWFWDWLDSAPGNMLLNSELDFLGAVLFCLCP